jgi:antitoxin CcdA
LAKQVTVTAKIPEQLKRRLASLKVNVSALIRRALEQEVEKAERERARKLADEARGILQKIPSRELVAAIRESREAR